MQHTPRRPLIQEKIYLITLFLVILGLPYRLCAQQVRPEIIDYYWVSSAEVWQTNQQAVSDRLVSCKISAVFEELSRGGLVKSADTSVARYFFTKGNIDSVVYQSGKRELSVDIDLRTPDIFDSSYRRFFFPNDTGAGDLAIGFETELLADPRPTGILTIDRDSYAAQRLHTSWPHKEGFRRFGRSFHFVQNNGLTLPDTIVELAVIERLLADDDYRLEITIFEYDFRPTIDSTDH
jgi:hypothetical protein